MKYLKDLQKLVIKIKKGNLIFLQKDIYGENAQGKTRWIPLKFDLKANESFKNINIDSDKQLLFFFLIIYAIILDR